VHSQAPVPLQLCPAAQLTQRAPPLPQAPAVGRATHWSFASQQPVGHVVGPHPVTRSGTASAAPSGPSAGAPSAVGASPALLSPALLSRVVASFVVMSVAVASWMTSFVGGSGRTSISLASKFPLSVRASAGAPPVGPPESAPAIPLRPPAPSEDASLDPARPAPPPVDEDPLSAARCPSSKPSRSLQDADSSAVPHTAKIHPARRNNCRSLKIMARQSRGAVAQKTRASFSSSGGRGGSSIFFRHPLLFGGWLGRLFRNGFVRRRPAPARKRLSRSPEARLALLEKCRESFGCFRRA